ncbi:hypothetical protein COOONC_26951 [Cooperia oncophora]
MQKIFQLIRTTLSNSFLGLTSLLSIVMLLTLCKSTMSQEIESNPLDNILVKCVRASVCLHKHYVRAKFKYGTKMVSNGFTCPSAPFCEMIDCYMCSAANGDRNDKYSAVQYRNMQLLRIMPGKTSL